jgi:hypothetical protein
VEEALIRSVFGFSANERLLETENIMSDFQIDTTSIKQELKGHYLEKESTGKSLNLIFLFPKPTSIL